MSRRAVWAAMLDELKQRADRAATSTEPLEAWHPHDLGHALPAELAERAARVVAAQSRAVADLRTQEQQLRSQLHALGPAAQTSSYDVPVYVDTVG